MLLRGSPMTIPAAADVSSTSHFRPPEASIGGGGGGGGGGSVVVVDWKWKSILERRGEEKSYVGAFPRQFSRLLSLSLSRLKLQASSNSYSGRGLLCRFVNGL